MTISFYGAAQTVTGSKHLITLDNGKRILLDCGMLQQGKAAAKNNRSFLFSPASVNYLIVSHAHIDHSGLIPLLVKKGFRGKIFATAATIELTRLLLSDAAKIQRIDSKDNVTPGVDNQPIYTDEDIAATIKMFIPVEYNQPYKIEEDIELIYTDAGHILGSAVINLSIKENGKVKTIAFSGDIGRYSNRILNPPEKFPQANVIICESTYGNKVHKSIEKTEERLLKIIKEVCIQNKGKLLIPAFSVGRTQELIFSLNKLAESGKLPDIPVFVDSPLAVYATDIVRNHSEYFNKDMKNFMQSDPDPFGFSKLILLTSHKESTLITSVPDPYIVISSSGMMEAGRILRHLQYSVSDERNGILLTGFAGHDTLGGKIARGRKKVTIIDETYQVNAKIYKLQEYSAHADINDILKFLSCQDKKKTERIFLVHGERRSLRELKERLSAEDYRNVEIAMPKIHYQV